MRIGALWLAAACTTTPTPIAPAPHEAEPGVIISGQWDGMACTPLGEPMTIVGRFVIAPFGKGTDGARLVPDEGKPWILSYRATPAMQPFDGKRVSVHGRPCEKQGQAILGRHFDASTLSTQ